jgi:RNA polymerase sigma-70 factor (ECF subfamily)
MTTEVAADVADAADREPDRELVTRFLAARSETAFRRLYRRHTPRLYQTVLRLVGGSGAEAEDVVQEVWLRAADRLEGFRWVSSLSTWLTGIAVNVCRETRRSRPREVEAAAEHEPAAGSLDPPGSGALDLERALAALPDGYRRVVILHDVEGYTHEETARLLGIEAGTSKSQLHQARWALRRLLEPGRQER